MVKPPVSRSTGVVKGHCVSQVWLASNMLYQVGAIFVGGLVGRVGKVYRCSGY